MKSYKIDVRSRTSSFKDHNIHQKSSFGSLFEKIEQYRPRDVSFFRLAIVLEKVVGKWNREHNGPHAATDTKISTPRF